jgi:hypothetical protein
MQSDTLYIRHDAGHCQSSLSEQQATRSENIPGTVELTEADLEMVQGGQGSGGNTATGGIPGLPASTQIGSALGKIPLVGPVVAMLTGSASSGPTK